MAEESSFVETTYSKHVEWNIKSFLDIPKTENYNIDSPCFSLCGATWFLRIHTNGLVAKNAIGWLSLYLRKKESAVDCLINFRMGLKASDRSQVAVICGKNVVFRKCEIGHGRAKFIERSQIKLSKDNLVPHGTLTIFCSARIVDQWFIPYDVGTAPPSAVTSAVNTPSSQTPSSDGVSTLMNNFKELYLSKRCADVRIIVKGREFYGHRIILSARSTVFSAMLTSHMVEESSSIVEIADCDPLSFEDFLLFLYTGDLDVVSISNATSLYATAKKYDIIDLMEKCVRCMSSKLTADSFCDVLHFASIYNQTDLLMTATNYFLENAKDIVVTLKWQTFLTENPSLGNELFFKYINKK